MYYSTRNDKIRIKASEAILKGLSDDGGLFLPETIPSIKIEDLLELSYNDLAKYILSLYLDDFTKEEIEYCVDKAYSKSNFEDMVTGLYTKEKFSILELFHGPTITFKDMALTLLPHLMEVSKKKNDIKEDIMILTATSGDTGSAALSGFSTSDNIGITVFYPDKGISQIQERQMLYFTSQKSRAYAIDESNFDDCQTLVKKILNMKQNKIRLSSANSINIGRLVPQIVYYINTYIRLVNENTIKLNDKIDVIVPTGNFGNIFACYLAKRMGTPIGKIVCASNENRVLTDFFETGTYSLKREFKKTNSPSMDIIISSNLERFIYLVLGDSTKCAEYMNKLKEEREFTFNDIEKEKLSTFEARSKNERETLETIKSCFDEFGYVLDPHTAVAYGAYKERNSENHTVIVSTASPYKFPETILEAFGIEENDCVEALRKVSEITNTELPGAVRKIIEHKIPTYHLSRAEAQDIVFKSKKFDCIVPSSSANIGPGFDVTGIALSLYNTFSFEKSSKDDYEGFSIENTKDNLVNMSYRRLFEISKENYIPVKITMKECNIPFSRGLGSSSTCIIAGLLAANEMLNRKYSKEEILSIATAIEGHPDNVAPALLGGMVSSFIEDGNVTSVSYPVSNKLRFIIAIPSEPLETSKARSVLPKEISYRDMTYNMSHIINIPKAMAEGDIKLLNVCIKDTIHTPYRLSLIKDSDLIEAFAKERNLPYTISGAGSSQLIISDKDETLDELKKINTTIKYEFISLPVDMEGARVKYYE